MLLKYVDHMAPTIPTIRIPPTPIDEGNEIFTVEEGWVKFITLHRPSGRILAIGDQITHRR